jgi:hypothetical protein
MKTAVLALVSGLLLPISGFATSFLDRDVSSLMEASTAVFEGRVVGIKAECGKGQCSAEIRIVPEKTYKGEPDASELRVCSFAPVIIGFRYVFFVESVTENQPQYAQCTSAVQRDAIFSRFGDAVYRYMSPGSFNTATVQGDEYLTGWILVKGFDEMVGSGQ